MNEPLQVKTFEKSVRNKFDVFNSLFLNLPFRGINDVGILLPLLQKVCREKLEEGKDPIGILDGFFQTHTDIKSEEEKIDFMFRVVQYIERQIVLYDSIEDAAFTELQKLNDDLSIRDVVHMSESKKILKKMASFSAWFVFTAHPTQFYSNAVLDIIRRLRIYAQKNDINQIDITLQQLGLTSLINTRKPTPFDEAKNIIYFFRHVYYDAVGELYAHIKRSIPGDGFDNPEIIRLGFWPGGDRDGNPFVTADITVQVADELRMTLMKCYYQDLKSLEEKLTFRGIDELLAALKVKLYETTFNPAVSIGYSEILKPLLHIRKMLKDRFNGLYMDDLDNFIDKVRIFGTHFATLDIRQSHTVHRNIIEVILQNENMIRRSLDELDDNQLTDILLHRKIRVDDHLFEDEVMKDTVRMISKLKTIQAKNGEKGCHRYIISQAEDIYSVLFVYALLRWCANDDAGPAFDIVPLFESMESLKNAGNIMEALLSIKEYAYYVGQRGKIQTIMMGFSDGTKDGGYLKANWSIFEAKERLSEICEKHGVKVIFFDGRGGPPARGGGKTHRFYASQSSRIASHALQLTIQGQTISSKYGTKEHFIHQCEQLLTAGLSHGFFPARNTISPESRELIGRMADLSFEKYTALKNHRMFIPYLENRSPLRYYGQTNIGSRPDRRGSRGKKDLGNLRAIPFVGSWSQLKQNVPGYFGIGTAIEVMIGEGRLEDLRKLFKEVPFFKALILNSMMSLSKCYFALTAYIGKEEDYREIWHILFEEYERSKKLILLISGDHDLMEEEPVTKNSIAIREQLVLPLLTIQQYALQMIGSRSPRAYVYKKIVRRSLYGNINASRNSA